jgi:hypothetical protein
VRSGLPFVALAAVACGRFGFPDELRDGAAGGDGPLPIDGTTADGSTGNCIFGALAVPGTGLLTGTTDGRPDNAAGSCGGAGSPDAIYFLDVPPGVARLRFVGDLPGIGFDSTVYARSDCALAMTERACDTTDGQGSNGQLLLDAPAAGPWYLFVDGSGPAAGGSYGASVELLRGTGAACAPGTLNGCMPEHLCFDGACVPVVCEPGVPQTASFVTTSSTAPRPNAHAGTCGASGDGGQRAPEEVHLLALADAVANVFVTTDSAPTDYDTLVYMRLGCSGAEVACDDDTAMSLSSEFDTGPLAAGDYYIFVDGFAGRSGQYELTVVVTP